MKRIELFFIQLFVLVMLGTVCNSMAATAASIPVDEANFPDKDFRQYVSEQIDKNSDRMLSDEEIANTRKIEIDSNDKRGLVVRNFRGIERFTELEELRILEVVDPKGDYECAFETDISLNLSGNTKLKIFVCKAGKIDGLDLSGFSFLEELYLHSYEYPLQDLSRITGLKRVYVERNTVLPDPMPEVTELSVGRNVAVPGEMPKLETLSLDFPDNPSVDFHHYPNLSELSLKWSTVKELDLSGMTGLKSFSCLGSHIKTINLRGCSGLEILDLSGLVWSCKNIYLGGCVNIRELSYYGKSLSILSEISISDMVNLEYLKCAFSKPAELDLRNNEKLKSLYASGNNMTDIKLSAKAPYEVLYLDNNQFTKLDLRNYKTLKKVSVNSNKLTDIKLSTKASYEYLDLDNNQLTKLDLRKIKAETVTCQRNDLKKLLLSSKGKFKKIAVDYNFLTKVDLRNIKVTSFTCRDNMIRSLKVRKNRTIRELDCRHNKLKALDLRQCKKLKKLNWYSGTKGLQKSKIRRK